MLKQRTWAIFTRPYYNRNMGGNEVRINYEGVPKAGRTSDLGYTTGTNTATSLLGNGEGGGDVSDGGWTMWYKGTSFKLVREKVKELLEETTSENLMIVELVDTDILVTPMS